MKHSQCGEQGGSLCRRCLAFCGIVKETGRGLGAAGRGCGGRMNIHCEAVTCGPSNAFQNVLMFSVLRL